MRRLAFLAAILAFFAGRSFGDDFFETGQKADPDHLVPIHSFMDDFLGGYDQLLAKHLFVTKGELGRMLVRPSFSPEFCFSVDIERPDDHAENHESAPPVGANSGRPKPEQNGLHAGTVEKERDRHSYIITVTAFTESTSRLERNAKKDGKPVRFKIERVQRKISRDLAVAIQRVWAKTLLLTRYPTTTNVHTMNLDGTTYQFSVFACGAGTLEGQTWQPRQGIPLELTNIGLDLVAFARQDPKGKTMTEGRLIDRLRKMESTIPQR